MSEIAVFNQQFIKNLPQDCPERNFVEAWGEYRFSAKKHRRVVQRNHAEMASSLLLGELPPEEDQETFTRRYPDRMAERLIGEGADDLLIAMMGLREALQSIERRGITFNYGRQRSDPTQEQDHGYVLPNPIIGFDLVYGYAPVSLIQVAPDVLNDRGVYFELGYMFNMSIERNGQ